MNNAMIIDVHAFDYIALWINLGLINSKNLAMVMVNSLDNN